MMEQGRVDSLHTLDCSGHSITSKALTDWRESPKIKRLFVMMEGTQSSGHMCKPVVKPLQSGQMCTSKNLSQAPQIQSLPIPFPKTPDPGDQRQWPIYWIRLGGRGRDIDEHHWDAESLEEELVSLLQ